MMTSQHVRGRQLTTRCLSAVGMMNWMAPEVLEQPYDAKSDTWAIGCLLLELTTVEIFTTQEIKGKLFEIKHHDEALEELLQLIGQVRSEFILTISVENISRPHSNNHTLTESCLLV